jgi:hypothetical protein
MNTNSLPQLASGAWKETEAHKKKSGLDPLNASEVVPQRELGTQSHRAITSLPLAESGIKPTRKASNLGPESLVASWLSRMRQAADGAIQAKNDKEAA